MARAPFVCPDFVSPTLESELTALGATTTVDFYRRVFKRDATPKHALWASKGFTIFWGLVAMLDKGIAFPLRSSPPMSGS